MRHFFISGTKYTFWDVAGNENFYRIWKNYIGEANLIVFFVDGKKKNEMDLD